ncbi:MAG: hypothetical protein R3C20_10615 [Planctomycetaceae bacterium]
MTRRIQQTKVVDSWYADGVESMRSDVAMDPVDFLSGDPQGT